jgi:hypothetical protein
VHLLLPHSLNSHFFFHSLTRIVTQKLRTDFCVRTTRCASLCFFLNVRLPADLFFAPPNPLPRQHRLHVNLLTGTKLWRRGLKPVLSPIFKEKTLAVGKGRAQTQLGCWINRCCVASRRATFPPWRMRTPARDSNSARLRSSVFPTFSVLASHP